MQKDGQVFRTIEIIIGLVFGVEYLLRVWSITSDLATGKYAHPVLGRIRYMTSVMAIMDLAVIIPFYAPTLIGINLAFLRTLRLIALLRIVKLGKYSHSLHIIGKVLRNKRHELGASFVVMMLLIVCASILMYFVDNPKQPNAFRGIPATLWWAVATVTTVTPYSNVFPVTHREVSRPDR